MCTDDVLHVTSCICVYCNTVLSVHLFSMAAWLLDLSQSFVGCPKFDR